MKNDKFLGALRRSGLFVIYHPSLVTGPQPCTAHPRSRFASRSGSFAGLTAQKWNHRGTQSSPAATKNLAILRVFVVDWARPLPRRREESGRVFDQSKNSFQLAKGFLA